MKIMIAYPALEGKGSPMLTQNRQFQWYHVGSYIYPVVSATAATLLKEDGFEPVWYDGIARRHTPEQFWRMLTAERPHLIVMESKTPVIRQHWKMIRKIKSQYPEIITVLTGDHVTALPVETMEHCPVDIILTGGDYDLLLLEVCRAYSDNRSPSKLPPGVWYREGASVRTTGPFQLNHDLNALPFIDRTLTQAYRYGEKWKRKTPFYYTMAGRDCSWGKCTFCAWTTLYPTFRAKTVSRFMEEIGHLIEADKAREIFDDTGTFPGGNWLRQFCENMIDRGYNRRVLFSCNFRFDLLRDEDVPRLMKKAGFRKIKVGLESANQATLDRLKKGIRVSDIVKGCKNAAKAGLDVHLTVMVGFPWETRRNAENTLNLARYLMDRGYAEMLQATVTVPYPGTPLYQEAMDKGWFACDPLDYDRFDMDEAVLKMPEMTGQEVSDYAQKLYRSFLSPRFILMRLLKTRNLADMDYLIRGARAVIGHLLDFGRNR